ncbi:MAG: chemotaxis protein CheW [Nitrospirae bacterium]|nr:chemotaxis protein CheW [Nitrospirota bacterium]
MTNNALLNPCGDLPSLKITNPLKLNILIFKISDISFGIDISQVYEMLDPQKAEEESIELNYIDKLIQFHDVQITYNFPLALIINESIKTASQTPQDIEINNYRNGIIIEMPLDIIEINIKSIQPLPFFIERCVQNAIWGVIIQDDNIIILIDIYRFDFKNKSVRNNNEHSNN